MRWNPATILALSALSAAGLCRCDRHAVLSRLAIASFVNDVVRSGSSAWPKTPGKSDVSASRPAPPSPTPSRGNRAPEPLRVGCWIPYWHRGEGAKLATRHIRLFDSISPFAYEVTPEGRLIDKIKPRRRTWRRLYRAARLRGTAIIPTIAWKRAEDIHALLTNRAARKRHIDALVKLVSKHQYDGLDINYEGKHLRDRDHFSRFLAEVGRALHDHGALLSCTVEARTTDTPPSGRRAGASMAWANDFAAIGSLCDQVRLMAYDQWFVTHGRTRWSSQTPAPHAPGADIRWVEQAVRYALKTVPARKLVLGIPTYGWLFKLEGGPHAWSYERFSALSHVRAQRLISRFGAVRTRAAGGELQLRYAKRGERRIGYLSDATSVREKINLARRLGLRGVVLFKIEGEEDPALWTVLASGRSAATSIP